ncbi:MAG: DUF808 domain-containing protein, partial [Variovorax sp.]
LIATFMPWAVTPLLMVGGAFLCFEGVEKLAHKFLHKEEHDAEVKQHAKAVADPTVDVAAAEKAKVKGAVRTDFILSAEIIVISLSTVAGQPFMTKLAVLTGIALIMTVGVYGLVAGIVKLDDAGLWLSQRAGAAQRALGRGLLTMAPWLMRALSVLGTAAMFLVGGQILVHGVPVLHHAVEGWAAGVGGVWGTLGSMVADVVVGIVAGTVVLLAVELVKKLRSKR